MADDERPRIRPTKNGPYKVEGLRSLSNQHGPIETKDTMWLCRCGGSSNKPFCDKTHARIGFSSAKSDDRVADRRKDYQGEGVTIHDNRGMCAHAAYCTDNLPVVFRSGERPWIDANAAPAEDIVRTIRMCPSGALSYSIDGVEHRDREGEPAIYLMPDGPYVVTGSPELLDTDRGEGASTEHYALCRCGGSKNKPFCDGTHWHIDFKAE